MIAFIIYKPVQKQHPTLFPILRVQQIWYTLLSVLFIDYLFLDTTSNLEYSLPDVRMVTE